MQQQNPNVPQAHPLKFRSLVRGGGGPKEAVNDVIDDAEELEDYAADCTGAEERAKLAEAKPRFEREKVIAVALGLRPTPAYEVEVVAVVQITGGFVGLQTQVHYVTRAPRGPATPPDALTVPGYPHHVVRVKNAGGLVIFRDVTAPANPPMPMPMPLPPPMIPPPRMTTMMVGEEGAPVPPPYVPPPPQQHQQPPQPPPHQQPPQQQAPTYTTMMVGEEVYPHPTTLAIGEEQAGGGPFGSY